MGACVQKDTNEPINQDIMPPIMKSQDYSKYQNQTNLQDQITKDQFIFDDVNEEDEKQNKKINYSEKLSMIKYRATQQLELEELRELFHVTKDQSWMSYDLNKDQILNDQTITQKKFQNLDLENETKRLNYQLVQSLKLEEIYQPSFNQAFPDYRLNINLINIFEEDSEKNVGIFPLSARDFQNAKNNEIKYAMERSLSQNSSQPYKSILKKISLIGSGHISNKRVTFENLNFPKSRFEQLQQEFKDQKPKKPQRPKKKISLSRSGYSNG